MGALGRVLLGLLAVWCLSCASGEEQEYHEPEPDPQGPDRQPPATDEPPAEFPPVTDFSAYLSSPELVADASILQGRVRASAPGVVTSVDKRRAIPSFFVAADSDLMRSRATSLANTESAAFAYLEQYRELYSLAPSITASTEVAHVRDTGRGSKLVQIRQRVDGLDVYGVRMSFLMRSDNRLVAIAGNLHGATETEAGNDVEVSDEAAVELVLRDLAGEHVLPPLLVVGDEPAKPARRFEAIGGWYRFAQPTFVKRVLYPMPKSLVPAHLVEMEIGYRGSTYSRAFAYVIAADDGRILERRNLTFADSFTYKVWADSQYPHAPLDGPHQDMTPHPTGSVDDRELDTAFVQRNVVAVDGLNTNPDGESDPWLTADSAQTQGNNIDAYADHNEPDGFSEGDLRATVSQNETFFWPVDGALGPKANDEQIMSSVTQIFYTLNWLHDYYYDSGFTESAGNAQERNFGRGGEPGDRLLAEAQDGAGKNNANMSTPSDGLNPRMQMFLWDGRVEPIGETTLTITQPAAIAGDYEVKGSIFGIDELVSANGALALARDEGGEDGVESDGCESFVTNVSGKIAVVDRGQCSFVQKSENARDAGALALIIVNQDESNPDTLPPLGGSEPDLAIPVVGISFAAGLIVKPVIANSAVHVDITRAGRIRHIDRDGTIDNSIVAHEWGHYYHHRNSICSGTTQCGAMSEGWGDFVALHLHVREGDQLDGVYAKAAFSTGDTYYGIRRVPYSVDFGKNALTLRHISDGVELPKSHPIAFGGRNSEVHNAGEVWATMLFEAYIALLKQSQGGDARMSFDEAKRRMADYMTAGLQLSPANATIVEVRDSILAAAAARDREDMLVLARAFARRGAGTGAKAPPRGSSDLSGVIESFKVGGALTIVSAEFQNSEDCDSDGYIDAAESALVRVRVMNAGPLELVGSRVSVETESDVIFPDGDSAEVATLGPYEMRDVLIPFKLSGDVLGMQSIEFTVNASNDASVDKLVASTIANRVNRDNKPESAKLDDVESTEVVWTSTNEWSDNIVWRRVEDESEEGSNAFLYARAAATKADQLLVSPLLEIGAAPFEIRFKHRHLFENSPGEEGPTYWDGGVIEISVDEGATWSDVSDFAVSPYGGTLTAGSTNPLRARDAFVGPSPSWPNWTTLEIDFGEQFANQTVMVRFRLGTDQAVGDWGWELDNLEFVGIENSPFATVVDDQGTCQTDGPTRHPQEGGCGCQTSDVPPASALAPLFLGLFALRRRRRSTRP